MTLDTIVSATVYRPRADADFVFDVLLRGEDGLQVSCKVPAKALQSFKAFQEHIARYTGHWFTDEPFERPGRGAQLWQEEIRVLLEDVEPIEFGEPANDEEGTPSR